MRVLDCYRCCSGPVTLAGLPLPPTHWALGYTASRHSLHLLMFPFCPQIKFRLACMFYEALPSYLIDSSLHLSHSLSMSQLYWISFNVLSKLVFISSPYLCKCSFLCLEWPVSNTLLPPYPSVLFRLSFQQRLHIGFLLIGKELLLWISKTFCSSSKNPFIITLHPKLHVYSSVPPIRLSCYFLPFLSLRFKVIPATKQLPEKICWKKE